MCASEWLARLASSEVREAERQRENLVRELASLPQPAAAPTSARLGWHSQILRAPETVWVQVDLGRSLPLDTIALVPANGAAQDAGGAGYDSRCAFGGDRG